MSVRALSLLLVGMAGATALSPRVLGANIDRVMAPASEEPDEFSETAHESPHWRLLHGVLQVQHASADFEVAIESLEDFVRTHPGQSEARDNLATLLAARVRILEARKRWVDRFVESSEPAETLRNIGGIYSHLAHLSYLRALAYPDVGETLAGRVTLMAVEGVETASLDAAASDTTPGAVVEGDALQKLSALGEAGSNPAGGTAAIQGLLEEPTQTSAGSESGEISVSAPGAPDGAERDASGTIAGSPGDAAGNFTLPEATSGTSTSTANAVASKAAAGHLAAMKDALTGKLEAGAKDKVGSSPSPASEPVKRDAGKTSNSTWWRPLVLGYGLAAGVVLLYLAIRAARNWIRSRNKDLRRRLRQAAAPLTGAAASEVKAGAGESIFRKVEGRSWLSWLWIPIESRYPLVDAQRAFPLAVGAGFAAAALCWFSIWFLKIPAEWWTLLASGLAGAGGIWYALRWQQARREAEFVRQFPEIVDQIVRLAGAGVPSVEALSVVTEDAPEPVQPVLRRVCDALLAGLDADTALRIATERVRLAEFTMFAAVIRLQRRAGGGISTAFSNLSVTLRERRKTALKAHASTAQTRLTLLVLTLMPVLVLLAQKFIAPASVEILFGTEQGTTLLQWGTGLIVTGILVARAIAARGSR